MPHLSGPDGYRPKRGDRVRIERDEALYPSRGSWPQFRGKVGTVVTINREDREWGVKFTASHDEPIHWFRPREMRPAGSRHVAQVTS
jgi:ribosomal protein L21E